MIIEEKLQRISKKLDKGSGELTFTVNGSNVRANGNCNKAGALLIALQAIRNFEMMGFSDSFEESMLILYSVNEITNPKILKKEIKKRNKDEAKDEK